ncbi:MAG: helix-turn-helix domain-containing protein [Clostridiales bacterium]|nr:helix-turn-helix domain-containing protein [Clostridiales bacterium]
MKMSTMTELDKGAIGIVIRRMRKDRGLSQEVLSGFACLARSHLAMIETGDKLPNFETVWRIAVALGVPPHELVSQIENESMPTGGRF